MAHLTRFFSAALRNVVPGALCLALAACGGGGGSSGGTSAAVAAINPTTVVSISATPTATTLGQVVSLTWSASNASSCTATGGWSGTQATVGTATVTPAAIGTINYGLTCNGVSNSTSVTVSAAPATPTVSLALAPANIVVGASSTLTWSSTNATACTASGTWSGSVATSGSLAVTQATAGTYTYNLTCTGSGGSTSASTSLTTDDNTAPLTVDNGPSGANGAINAPFVSVTVCAPGTTTCQTIDHILLDTGSYGLRLITPLNAALALPAVTTDSGVAAGECATFVSGYTWGALRQADITIGGKTATAQSIQVVGDTGSAYATTPASCSSTGSNVGTVAALGANGVLGVGLQQQDCGATCVSAAPSGAYYACNGSTCTPTAMPLARQVSNPVASFASDNNGVVLVLPAVGTSGATSLTGTLIFGVGTQTNNALGSATVYLASSTGYFRTTYKSKTYTKSFIDSGSNGLYFDDSSLPSCTGSTGFYCPSTATALSAVNSAYDSSTSGTVTFTLINADRLTTGTIAAVIGGPASSGGNGTLTSTTFDWGLPFFFGRSVYVVMEGATAGTVTGPFWAY